MSENDSTVTPPENELSAFLKQETARALRAARTTWIVGLALFLFAIGYLTALLALIQGMLDPKITACMVAQRLDAALPAMMLEAEASLRNLAPAAAEALSARAMEAMSEVREEAERQIDLTYEQVLPLMEIELRQTVRAHVDAHADEIRNFYRVHQQPDFPDQFLQAIAQDAMSSLDRASGGGFAARRPGYFADAVLQALATVNAQIETLRDKPTEQMDRSERLQRRLIVAWLRVIEEAIRQRQFAPRA